MFLLSSFSSVVNRNLCCDEAEIELAAFNKRIGLYIEQTLQAANLGHQSVEELLLDVKKDVDLEITVANKLITYKGYMGKTEDELCKRLRRECSETGVEVRPFNWGDFQQHSLSRENDEA